MAIGYGKIILNKFDNYFEDFLKNIQNSYQIFNKNNHTINVITDDGDYISETVIRCGEIFKQQKILSIRVINAENNPITLSICEIDNYLIEESYSMEELLSEAEESDLLDYLKSRFNRLLDNKIAIGFIFDPIGYSEDYLLIPPPNWQTAHECWRKLMGG